MLRKSIRNALIGCVVHLPILLSSSAYSAPAFDTGTHRNLFVEMGLAGSEQQVKDKVNAAYQQLFYGSAANERVFFEAGADMAYILAVDSNDIRSEGMSYGMMAAVMVDDKIAFDKLWKFSKTKMQHQTGDRKGYFSWQLSASSPFNAIDMNPAPDGEEYFAMALMFAAHRWGDQSGIFNYTAEADFILDEMLNKTPNATQVTMINPVHKQIVFTTDKRSEAYTDPSYHLPGFYELWSRWGKQDAQKWLAVAETSREFFNLAAHPVTGLYTDYANFDGSPKTTSFNQNSHLSAFDAMRTIQNVAFDYAWFEDDPRAVELSNRILSFYKNQGNYVTVYTHDGIPQVTYRMEAHVAMNAVAALASDLPIAKDFVQDLWQLPVPTGQWRYYNGLLYMLGLLHVSGEFKIYGPQISNGLPKVQPISTSTDQNKTVQISLLGSDPGGSISSYTLASTPINGSAALNGSTVSYTPNTDFSGEDSFSYFATDNENNSSAVATVTIQVKPEISTTIACTIGDINIWNSGFVLNNIKVVNNGLSTLNGWQVSIPVNTSIQVSNQWNASVAVSGNTIIASGNENIAPGQSVVFGMLGAHDGSMTPPKCVSK